VQLTAKAVNNEAEESARLQKQLAESYCEHCDVNRMKKDSI